MYIYIFVCVPSCTQLSRVATPRCVYICIHNTLLQHMLFTIGVFGNPYIYISFYLNEFNIHTHMPFPRRTARSCT